MKNPWTQPSLSRDFALLSASALFVLCIISAWVTYTTYTRHTQTIASDLEKESKHLESAIAMQIDDASYMLTSLGKQIIIDPDRNLTKLAQVLKSFDKKDYRYSILTWINPQGQMEISSNRGVLEKPVDISDRDFVKMATSADPWKMVIGQPIEGRVSGQWVIPVAMGVTDYTGKFIGIVAISLNIKILTEQLEKIVQHEGISFAIANRNLVPITQASDNKDFSAQNFPIQKLENINFTKNPNGLITQSTLFWEIGNYYYYRACADLPYVLLLSYDAQYSDGTVRDYLWYRLLQMIAMGMFFVLFLWITRVRMIKPIMEMSNIVADVARGKPFEALPKGGPVEIEALAGQIHKVSDYIGENKRIESELRHKIHQFMKAKDQAEMNKRSQMEFLAYVCHDLRNPLNSIIGGAQVIKDQLHGPMENRKYRQYITDIFGAANSLMNRTQDLVAMAKSETGYFELSEKPVDIADVIRKSVRFISDKMQAETLSIKIQMQEPIPRLMADEFRLQQILTNLFLQVIDHAQKDGTIMLETTFINESRDKGIFAFVISSTDKSPYTNAALLSMADELLGSTHHRPPSDAAVFSNDHTNISLELAKTLIALHSGAIDITESPDNSIVITVFFPGNRVRFMDSGKL